MQIDLNSREIHMLLEAILHAIIEIDKLDPEDNSIAAQLLRDSREGYERLKKKILDQI